MRILKLTGIAIISFAFLILPNISFAISQECSSLNGLLTLQGLAGSSEAERQMADCIAKENISSPNYTIDYSDALYKATRDAARIIYDAQQQGITEVKEKYIAKKEKECKERYTGDNSHYQYEDEKNYERGDCSCNAGYALYEIGGVCEIKKKDVVVIKPSPLQTIICQKKYSDPNSHAEGNSCVCNEGYFLYKSDGICELKKAKDITPTDASKKEIVEVKVPISVTEPIKKEVTQVSSLKKPIKENKTDTESKKETIISKEEIKENIPPIVIESKKSFFSRFFTSLFSWFK